MSLLCNCCDEPVFGYHTDQSKTWLIKDKCLHRARELFGYTEVNITSQGRPYFDTALGLKITSRLWPRKCTNGRRKCLSWQVWLPYNHMQPLSMVLPTSSTSCPEQCVLRMWIICYNLLRIFSISSFLPGLIELHQMIRSMIYFPYQLSP